MVKKNNYQPPYTVSSAIVGLIAEIGEVIGRYSLIAETSMTPYLRRENRIRTIQASLAIENNSLTLEQVTAVINGKGVLGHPREIQEVRNAFAAYEAMEKWDPTCLEDLMTAHRILMTTLIDDPGIFRSGGVGIYKGDQLVHMAPPANRVSHLMDNLFNWLHSTKEHPLVASCVFHYELEFIHPFSDGNGRMGRLWQTLILSCWRPLMAYLPVETVIRDRQQDYYNILSESDTKADITPFIEFMLGALLDAIHKASTDQATSQVSDQVALLLGKIGENERSASEIIKAVGLTHLPTFRKNYLNPAIDSGWIELTQPNSPRSPTQRYRLTGKGKRWLLEGGPSEKKRRRR
jgi:Fic family protein